MKKLIVMDPVRICGLDLTSGTSDEKRECMGYDRLNHNKEHTPSSEAMTAALSCHFLDEHPIFPRHTPPSMHLDLAPVIFVCGSTTTSSRLTRPPSNNICWWLPCGVVALTLPAITCCGGFCLISISNGWLVPSKHTALLIFWSLTLRGACSSGRDQSVLIMSVRNSDAGSACLKFPLHIFSPFKQKCSCNWTPVTKTESGTSASLTGKSKITHNLGFFCMTFSP